MCVTLGDKQMNKWVEIKTNDILIFNSKTGSGSVVETANHGRYFMPAKIGMRLKGEKKPIVRNERFIFSNAKVQKVDGSNRIVKFTLLREIDGTIFSISENDIQTYFAKSPRSSLGGMID